MFQAPAVQQALTDTQRAFVPPPVYQKRDFVSAEAVRWCPGCGDYAILAAMQRACAQAGKPPHQHVFISGIGCAARFPYYMNTYGFHTIHGRAPGVATGLALTRRDLTTWVLSGDGDALSIGVGHLLHLLRRNLNINVILFNNRIYGLTKGQYSPTSEAGKVTRSSPQGTLATPFAAVPLVMAAGASFVARVLDKDLKMMEAAFTAAMAHSGSAFIEIYQNCNVFNDGAYASFTDKSLRADTVLHCVEGEPLRYGTAKCKVITWDGYHLASQTLPHEAAPLPATTWIYRTAASEPASTERVLPVSLRTALMQQLTEREDLPTPFGILHRHERPCYETGVEAEVKDDFLPQFADPAKRDAWLQRFITGDSS